MKTHHLPKMIYLDSSSDSFTMRTFPKTRRGLFLYQSLVLVGLLASAAASTAQTFNVTGGNNINYTVDGQGDPSLTLERGVTYVFQLSNVSFHPFWIKSSSGIGSSGAYNDGVVNNGATLGNVTFTVPANAPDALFYQCGNHSGMLGTLGIVSPASPPTVRIVHVAVGQNVVVTSTGTIGWSAIPEFKCDLNVTNWTTIAPFTNSFVVGTNITSFDRLEAVCGSPTVFLRIRNQKN